MLFYLLDFYMNIQVKIKFKRKEWQKKFLMNYLFQKELKHFTL